MILIGGSVFMLMCVSRLTLSYVIQNGGAVVSFRQAPVLERIINENPEPSQPVVNTGLSGNHEGVGCEIGRLFYINHEGRLMRCRLFKEKEQEIPGVPQNPPHILWPGLSPLGLAYWGGGRFPVAPLAQAPQFNDDSWNFPRKKPIIVKPKPIVPKPVQEPIIITAAHQPFVHKHPHAAHHHSKPCVHVSSSEITAYHQTGHSAVNPEQNPIDEDKFRTEEYDKNPVQSGLYEYYTPPRMTILMPLQAQRIISKYILSNPDKHGNTPSTNDESYPDVMKDKFAERTKVIGNISSTGISEIIDITKKIVAHDLMKNSPSDSSTTTTVIDSFVNNRTTNEKMNSSEVSAEHERQQIEVFDDPNSSSKTDQTSTVVNEISSRTENNSAALNKTGNSETQINQKEVIESTDEALPSKDSVPEVPVESGKILDSDQQQKDDMHSEAIKDYDNQNAEYGVDEGDVEKSLSDGPDVMEDGNLEVDGEHVRKIRDTLGIPIEILNDQQSASTSVLDRNTLLTIMSSLKEQYLKNAEPDQKKLIEEAFDRLHCSVRDMKKLDERPTEKKIDGSKRAALKLLAEGGQLQMDEPDYYSDATDDVSAEPSFLELLNVATKHKGKQPAETE